MMKKNYHFTLWYLGIIILFSCLIIFNITSLALIPGDFGSADNGPPDGVVDFEDLMIFALAYGSTPSDPNWNEVCDIASLGGSLTPDGVIDFEDLMIFALHYGEEEGFITVEGDYSGFYNFPRQFFESSSLVPEDVVKVTDRIYLLEKELASGDAPFSFAKGEYKEDVYGCTSPEGFILGEAASPANNNGHHSWDVIAHEMGHSFWSWSNFFYTLATPGPFLHESTAVLTAQYVYERIKQDPNNFNLPQEAITSLDAVYTEEWEYQRGRYEEYVNLGNPYSQDESGPNYAILTSQALNYKWFLIGDEYGWKKFQRFYKGFSTDLKDDFTFWQDGVSDIEETTYMIAALNVAFNQDFRQEFRDLNFPIDDDLYNEIYSIILEYID